MRTKVVVASSLAAFLGVALALAPRPAEATLEMQKKAKEAGFSEANCLYCHNEKLPKKGAVTHNDRGKWLIAQKQAKKAKEVDVGWLKDYVVPK
jgi:hypothetical protein